MGSPSKDCSSANRYALNHSKKQSLSNQSKIKNIVQTPLQPNVCKESKNTDKLYKKASSDSDEELLNLKQKCLTRMKHQQKIIETVSLKENKKRRLSYDCETKSKDKKQRLSYNAERLNLTDVSHGPQVPSWQNHFSESHAYHSNFSAKESVENKPQFIDEKRKHHRSSRDDSSIRERKMDMHKHSPPPSKSKSKSSNYEHSFHKNSHFMPNQFSTPQPRRHQRFIDSPEIDRNVFNSPKHGTRIQSNDSAENLYADNWHTPKSSRNVQSYSSYKRHSLGNPSCAINSPILKGLPTHRDTKEFGRISKEMNMSTMPFIDTHCHLDFIYRKLHYQDSFSDFMADCKNTVPFPKNFDGCVSVFCEPNTFWKKRWWEDIIENDYVWGAFGCHPHHANMYSTEEEKHLRQCLAHPKTVAIGEMGLDYSFKNKVSSDTQKTVFCRQLKLAKEFKKPLVIHCRDAHEDCLEICKNELDKNTLIHRHCFTETPVEARELMQHFPNMYFGFTCLITKKMPKLDSLREAVKFIPLNRILLETDGPYFLPNSISSKVKLAHPGMAIYVALEVAKLKNCSLDEVLKVTRENTKIVYNI